MKPDKINILEAAQHRDGMTVPDGYFNDFVSRMESMLPQTEFELSAEGKKKLIADATPTRWQRVRPYVYMAAMFAGAWCMLKMFTILTGAGPQPLDTNTIMAEAMGNDAFVNEYVIDDLSQWDIYDEMMDEGFNPCVLTDSMLIDTITD